MPLATPAAAAPPAPVPAPAPASMAMGAAAKRSFIEKIKNTMNSQQYSHTFSKDTLGDMLRLLHGWDGKSAQERSSANKSSGNNKLYKMSKKFCVVELPGHGEEIDLVLCERNADGGVPSCDMMRVIVPLEDWFEKIGECHLQGGHAKSRALEKRVNDKYARIPRWALTVRFSRF